MVIICDLLQSGTGHLMFNSAFLKVISNIYDNKEIRLCCERKMYENIKVETDLQNLIYEEISNDYRTKQFKLCKIFNWIISIKKLIKILRQGEEIYIMSIHPVEIYLLSILNKIFSRKIYIVIHGEACVLEENFKDYRSKIIYNLFTSKDMKIKYIVLGESIYNNIIALIKKKDQISKKLIYIDHPYIFKEYIKTEYDDERTILISSIGAINNVKRSYKIFDLAEKFKSDILQGKVNFEIIGNISKEYEHLDNGLVKFKEISDEHVSQKYLEDRALKSKYLIFFYDVDSYKLTASGAFFDALKYDKPIICIKNDYFKYYFNKYGDIGYMVEDYNDIKISLEVIIRNNDNEEYKRQKENIKAMKKDLSIKNITTDLCKKLNLYGV